eukprot:3930517-Pyramimonas_sp.AAC.1
MPYIINGDFQMTPDQLNGSGWVEAIDGAIVAPSVATCSNSAQSKGRVLDFFIVSATLQYGATAELVHGVGTKPHSPVLLTLQPKVAQQLCYRVARVPKRFPVELPIGCRRHDPDQYWADAQVSMTAAGNVDGMWQEWIRAAEKDWADIYDVSLDEHP